MRVYLTQHGLAVPKDIDPDRPLSEQGRQDVRCLAELLEHAGIRVAQVFHSGKTRAEQTAALLAAPLLSAGRPQARAGLDPNDAVEPFYREISAWTGDTLIVGHLPFLGRLASLVLAGDPDRPSRPSSRAAWLASNATPLAIGFCSGWCAPSSFIQLVYERAVPGLTGPSPGGATVRRRQAPSKAWRSPQASPSCSRW